MNKTGFAIRIDGQLFLPTNGGVFSSEQKVHEFAVSHNILKYEVVPCHGIEDIVTGEIHWFT